MERTRKRKEILTKDDILIQNAKKEGIPIFILRADNVMATEVMRQYQHKRKLIKKDISDVTKKIKRFERWRYKNL